MANRYYGVSVGGDRKTDVTEDTSTTSAAIELVVDDAATGISKLQVLKALEAIKAHILHDDSIK